MMLPDSDRTVLVLAEFQSVRLAAVGLTTLYILFATQEIWFLVSFDEPSRAGIVLLDLAAACSFATLSAWVAGTLRLVVRPNLIAVLAASVVILHGLLAQLADDRGDHGLRAALAVVGTGLLVFSPASVVTVGALGTAFVFLSGVLQSGSVQVESGLVLVVASAVGFIAQRIRRRVEVLRGRAERRMRALELSEERYALALAGSRDGLYDWDVDAEEIQYSGRWPEILGIEADQVEKTPQALLNLIHREDRPRVVAALDAHWQGATEHFEAEFRVQTPDGRLVWILMRGATSRDEHDRAVRMAGSLTEMSAHGMFDALTGLPNRRLVLDRLGRLLERRANGSRRCALLFLDLDDFKVVNDTLGHAAGDQLIAGVAQRLRTCVRASDTVARAGGDEFVILLEQIDLPHGAVITIDRIVEKLGAPYLVSGRELYVRASIGAVVDTQAYEAAGDVLRDADTAMYAAKGSGEGWAIFDSSMGEAVAQRLQIDTELRKALERREFRVHYQPIVELATGRVSGFEALVYWQHPVRGKVSPAEFIPALESSGLITQLDTWVLRQATQDMEVRYPSRGNPEALPYLSVNFSRRHLQQPDLVEKVEAILEHVGFHPNRLAIEVTETAVVDDLPRATASLTKLRDLGINIMMDDFGTGQSSLGALRTLPIDTVKIDRSFVSRISDDEAGAELVRALVQMCGALNLRVVAEGVETAVQCDTLRALSCDSAQGYLFSRPRPLPPLGEACALTRPVQTAPT